MGRVEELIGEEWKRCNEKERRGEGMNGDDARGAGANDRVEERRMYVTASNDTPQTVPKPRAQPPSPIELKSTAKHKNMQTVPGGQFAIMQTVSGTVCIFSCFGADLNSIGLGCPLRKNYVI